MTQGQSLMAKDTRGPTQSIWGQGHNSPDLVASFPSSLSTGDGEPFSKPREERGPLEKNEPTLFNTFAQSINHFIHS